MVDEGRSVMIGDLDDPDTYRRARVDEAALVVATRSDTSNTNVAFTVREISPTVPIAATASSSASVDILELAGCDLVLHLGQLLGAAMARRVLGNDHCAHEIGAFDELVVAEATAAGTPFVGSSLMEIDLRGRFGVSVAGFLRRGNLELASPERVIGDDDVMVLVGSSGQLDAYDSEIGTPSLPDAGVVIIGGGRVGRAAAHRLEAAGLHCRIVEQKEELIRPADDRYVQGDAAELEVLEEAGLSEASAVLITTHDDDINIYLTIYCRRLRPELQIIPRANLDRNVATLHRAGADSVLSYASIGATTIWNAMSRNDTVVLAEGLEVFRVPCPTSLAATTLAEAEVRSRTGCSVVAIATAGSMVTNPDPRRPLPGAGELVLIGDSNSQSAFLEAFPVSARAGA
jgi:Trk K+ transport system NAD-binding subunit